MTFISIFYVVNSLLLAVYGFNSIYLVWLYRKNRKPRQAPPPPVEWPRVTVQLPVYNEMETLERLIEAVAGLDYPLDRFEVQVLDDSTDATTDLIASKVAGLQRVGLNITHIYRDNRTGFKAGALAAGVKRAQGEFIAIFDADFVPPPDFLRKTLPWFEDQEVGCVQARWGHLNREYSTFTRLQALGVDGHFLIEQVARSRGGLFLNFNGTDLAQTFFQLSLVIIGKAVIPACTV